MKSSIIIPVYNNLRLTLNCLESLAGSSYYKDDSEVIIVDDSSNDGTEEYFTQEKPVFPRLVYHRNRVNLKFAGACNAGAKRARGKYLIFLNNDTIVMPDWDKHLLDILENDRNAWIAGAKLLYPDGTLQHAGVYIPELTPQSFGHVYAGFPSCFPPANRAKELQCVTAACLAIRKEDFDSLEGFDETYRNGCEDIDLCLRVIREGKKIIYQPASEVIHLESMSEGRFDRSANNAALLFERWNGKVQPDMFDRIGEELNDCMYEGLIREISRIESNEEWQGIRSLNPEMERNPNSPVMLRPDRELIFAVPQNTGNDEELFIDIRCRAGEKIPVILTYQTRNGYRHEKILKTTGFVYKGNNHLLFPLKPGFMGETAAIRIEKQVPGIEITSMKFNSFLNPEKKKSEITIIYNIDDQIFINDLGDKLRKFLTEFTIRFAAAGNSPDKRKLNGLIGSLDSGYIMVLEKGMNVVPKFIVHAMEVMELQPEIGFVYSDIEVIRSDKAKIIGFDFNPATILTKNKPDMAGIFRRSAWEAVGGYDENIRFYSQTDLFLGILSTRLWKNHHIMYRGISISSIFGEINSEQESEAKDIRSKHTNYLYKISPRRL